MKVVILENFLKKGWDARELVDSWTPILTRIYWGIFVWGKELQMNLVKGEELKLEWDPQNKYDTFAVSVKYRGKVLGYIKKELSTAMLYLNEWHCLVHRHLQEGTIDIGAEILLVKKKK